VAAFVHEERLDEAAALPAGTAVIALTADPLGRAGRDLGRAEIFSRIVPSMGDSFPGGTDPADALVAGDGTATMERLLGEAAELAARTGLGDGDRLLTGRRLLTAGGAVAGLLAPFARGAGVVLVNNLDPDRFWKRVADERVSVAVLDPDQAAAVRDAGPGPGARLRVLLDD
jgi:hypothetical protein